MTFQAWVKPSHSTPVPEQAGSKDTCTSTYVFFPFHGCSPNGMVLGLRIPHEVDHRLEGVCRLLDLARVFRCELVRQPLHLSKRGVHPNVQARRYGRRCPRPPSEVIEIAVFDVATYGANLTRHTLRKGNTDSRSNPRCAHEPPEPWASCPP